MSDTSVNNIVFKLTIDGQEGIAVLNVVKGEFLETGAAAEKGNEVIKQGYQSLTTELLKYNSTSENSVNSLIKFIQTQSISLDMIEKSIAILQSEAKTLAVNSDAWKQKMAAATNLKAAYGQMITQNNALNDSNRSVVPGMNSMNLAMGQFGYLLSDADMFLVNFQMGLRSIGNNVPMVVQYLQYAKSEATALNMTVGQAFMKSIAGPGGLLLGANAAMFAMQLLTQFFSDSTKEVEKHDDALEKLKKTYEELSKTTLQSLMTKVGAEIFELENKGGLGARDKGTALAQWLTKSDLSDSDQERLKLLYDQRSALDSQYKTLGEIDALKNRINENEKAYAGVSELNLNTQYRYLREHLDNKGWEANADNARKLLKEWIDGDKKQLEATDKLHDKSMEKLKQFQEHKAKAITDLIKDEYELQEAERLTAFNYRELLEERELKENELGDIHTKIRNAKNQTELTGYLVQKDLTEKSIKLIDDQIKKEEEQHEKLIDNYRKDKDEKLKARIADEEYQKDKGKWNTEFDYKFDSDPLERQRKELDAEETLSIQRAEIFGASEEQKTNIHKYYSKQRERIDQQAQFALLDSTSRMLGQLAGMFSKQTAAYKLLASAQVMIETYKAIMALYAPPPIGVGPVLAPFMTGFVGATGALQVANIMATNTSMPGYARGGAIVGENGIEVIAPAQDYATGMAELVNRTAMEVQNHFASGSGSGGNSELIKEIQAMRSELTNIKIPAYFDNKAARDIYREGKRSEAKRK